MLQPLWAISAEPIVITGDDQDPDHRRILYINQAFTDMTGYSSEDAVGKPSSFLHGQFTDADDVERSEEHLRTGDLQEYELKHYRKDGSAYQCTIMRAPLLDLDGTSEYLISMYKVAAEHDSSADDIVSQIRPVPLTSPLRWSCQMAVSSFDYSAQI